MTPERIDEIYEELPQLVVELNPDPPGPAYLQDQISLTRGYLNKTAFYMQELLRDKNELEDQLAAAKAAFEIEASSLLTEDPRVTRLPNISDRQAMINVILVDDRREILSLEVRIQNLAAVEKVIKHRHRELERTVSEIRLQWNLMQSELKTGSYYGDESPEAREGSTFGRKPPMETVDENELNRLMAEADAELGDDEEAAAEEDNSETEEDNSEAEDGPSDELSSLLADADEELVETALEEGTGNGTESSELEEEPEEDPAITRFLDGEGDGDDYDDLFVDL